MDNAQRVARRRRKIFTWIGVIVILIGFGAWFGWYKFFREEPQPAWVTQDADTRFKYDIKVPGNGNAGHEGKRYGTELSPDEKEAVVEYLKTF